MNGKLCQHVKFAVWYISRGGMKRYVETGRGQGCFVA